MKDEIAISLKNVSKTFRYRQHKNDSIRKRWRSFFEKSSDIREIKALQNVSFNIKRGEFIGIIGRNGSGKSTLLKTIIGAIKPDKGQVNINGKIVRLALGLGFDPNLTARDNIYVNGSILGLTFRQIGKRFDAIIDFAELKEFVDTPIKFYSSGMQSRLSFAIAMHVDADILLIDEFFGGVGDEAFRKKSAAIFKKTFLDHRTIVFVSHSLALIKEYCNLVAIMNEGHLSKLLDPEQALKLYGDKFN